MKKLVIRGDYTAKNLLLITEDENKNFAPLGQIKHIKGQTWRFTNLSKSYTLEGVLKRVIKNIQHDYNLQELSREYWTVETKQAAREYILNSWESYEKSKPKNLHGVNFSEFGEATIEGEKRSYYVHIRTILEQLDS